MLSFLPEHVKKSINKLDPSKLNEIRFRSKFPVNCSYDFDKYYLSANGVTKDIDNALIITDSDVNYIIQNLTENSLYAYNDYVKNGFITSKEGIRVGIAGTCVFDDEKITTIKDVKSLCIRIPHDVIGCSNYVFNKIRLEKSVNVLIISPPGYGKTTILKDLIRNYNENTKLNLLVINERGELNIKGKNIDVISYSNKAYALKYSIQSMAPDVIFMDELISENDFLGAYKAIMSGVNVIATIHSDSIGNTIKKFNLSKNIFDYFVLLKKGDKPGEILGVYDKNEHEI